MFFYVSLRWSRDKRDDVPRNSIDDTFFLFSLFLTFYYRSHLHYQVVWKIRFLSQNYLLVHLEYYIILFLYYNNV